MINKQTLKWILELLSAIITAFLTALGVSSCTMAML